MSQRDFDYERGFSAGEAERTTLQQRLTAANERVDHWRSVASEATCRAAALNYQLGELTGQEAELYAAQDQITGLQELMATQRAPELLDTAVRHLVAAAEADDSHQGSPEHGHRIAGRWDGDATHARGSLCEECAAWDIMRKYAATDIEAVAEVPQPKPGDVYALPVDLVVDLTLYPSNIGSVEAQLGSYGIRWRTAHRDDYSAQVELRSCTSVPVNLPAWLKVKS